MDHVNNVVAVMRGKLQEYAPGPDLARLNQLVSELSGALDRLDGQVDEEWLQELRGYWWPLEYVNAKLLAEDRNVLSREDVRAVGAVQEEFLAALEGASETGGQPTSRSGT